MADFGLFSPISGAMKGVPIITSTDLIRPAATDSAMISLEAPSAVPVTGPTI